VWSKNATEINALENNFEFNNYVYFGTMPRAMYTLFSLTILTEFVEVGRPLLETQPGVTLFVLAFTVLFSIGIVNVIVGVIIESTLSSAKIMDYQVEQEEVERQVKYLKATEEFLTTMDTNSDGLISIEELKDVWESLEALNIPYWFTPTDVLTLVDYRGHAEVEREAFSSTFRQLLDMDEFHHRCSNNHTINIIMSLCLDILKRLKLVPSSREFKTEYALPYMAASSPVARSSLIDDDDMSPTKHLAQWSAQLPPELALPNRNAPPASEAHVRALLERIDQKLNAPQKTWCEEEVLARIESRIQSLETSLSSLTRLHNNRDLDIT